MSLRGQARVAYTCKLAATHPELEQRSRAQASHDHVSGCALQRGAFGLGRIKNAELSALVDGLRNTEMYASELTARMRTCG